MAVPAFPQSKNYLQGLRQFRWEKFSSIFGPPFSVKLLVPKLFPMEGGLKVSPPESFYSGSVLEGKWAFLDGYSGFFSLRVGPLCSPRPRLTRNNMAHIFQGIPERRRWDI